MQELFIDWDVPRLTCVEVSRAGEEILGVQANEFVAPEDLADVRRGRELGEWLTRELAGKQIAATSWTVVLPRDRVTMRRLELPGVPEAEMAMVIPFQMSMQLGSSPEQMIVDFLSNTPGSVMAASLPAEVMGQIKLVAAQCGASVSRVLVSSCLVTSVRPDAAKRALVLWGDQHRIEAVYTDAGAMQAASCRRRNSLAPMLVGELAGEARRQLMNVDTTSEAVRLFVWGPAADLAEELGEKLGLAATTIGTEDLSAKVLRGKLGPEQLESLPALGQLALLGMKGTSADQEQVDFINPRKAAAKQDRRLLYGLAGGLAAVLLIGMGLWMWNSRLGELDSEIETLRTQIRDGETFIEAREQVGLAASKIDKHVAQQVEMSAHFAELLATLPGTERMFLTSYTLIPLSGEYRGRVVASGLAKRRIDVELFFEQLTQRGLRVKPSPIDEETRRDRDYPVEFKLELDIPASVARSKGETGMQGSRS